MTEGSLFDVSTLDTAATPSALDPGHGSRQTQSLYRKYRPQSFAEDDLFGQDHIVNTLRNAIALNRIAHAYLFCGPRGTGKTTTARLLAKAVNCLDPDPHKRPCNACNACVAINRNATTDVIEIDAASNRGIDDIRDLRERVTYAPTQLATKFYIIDEAHQITGAAANAFLKTLEEPPPHTKFILATTDPEELLQTIVSRCQRFDFRRINMEAMIACLRKVARLEGIAIDSEAVPVIARHATGSLRDALGVLDQVAVYRESSDSENQPVTIDTVRSVLGVSRNDRVASLALALADQDAAAGLRAINEAVEAGDDIRQLGRQLVAYLRMLLLHRAGGPSDADEGAKSLAERFSLSELAEFARVFSDIDVKVKHSAFPQLPLEIAMVSCATRDIHPADATAPLAQLDQLAAQPRDAEGGLSGRQGTSKHDAISSEPPAAPRVTLRDRVRGQPANPDRPSPPRTAEPASPAEKPSDGSSSDDHKRTPQRPDEAKRTAEPLPPPPSVGQPMAATGGEITLDMIVELWSRIRADVKAVNRRIEALLQQIDPVAVAGSKVFLVSPYEFHRNRMNSDEARTVVEDVVSRLVKQRVQVTCVTREEASTMTTVHSSSEPAPEISSLSDSDMNSSTLEVSAGSSEPSSSDAAPIKVTASEGPSQVSSPDANAQRITAAKNIFDAEEFDD